MTRLKHEEGAGPAPGAAPRPCGGPGRTALRLRHMHARSAALVHRRHPAALRLRHLRARSAALVTAATPLRSAATARRAAFQAHAAQQRRAAGGTCHQRPAAAGARPRGWPRP